MIILDPPKGKLTSRPKYDGDGDFVCVWFGRLVCPVVTVSKLAYINA